MEEKPFEPMLLLIDGSETVLQSWAKDLMTFGLMGLCIYASQGNVYWSIVTSLIFILFIFGRMVGHSSKTKRFASFKELAIWVEEKNRLDGRV